MKRAVVAAALALALVTTVLVVPRGVRLAPAAVDRVSAAEVGAAARARPHYGAHAWPDLIPGALPRGFRYHYNDAFRGWPLWPLHAQHPVRGSFLDPRPPAYHFGIDISVDDSHPDPRAPWQLSHRVYAIESGLARDVHGLNRPCVKRRVEVGHFAYWHVSPTVKEWQHVLAGEAIGWTCLGEWHVHLSEWARLDGRRVWVNPLHAGGKLAPYTDTAPPVVEKLRFFTPPRRGRVTGNLSPGYGPVRLSQWRLVGRVELRAEIGDPQSFWGFLARHPRWEVLDHPYRVAVVIRSLATGTVILRRVSFQSDQLPSTPYLVHYAPGTRDDVPISECRELPEHTRCLGAYWFRPFSRFRQEFWDTTRFPDGVYEITVSAWDMRGNKGTRTVLVVVANAAGN